MADSDPWQRLSLSSRQAMRWAWAHAQLRGGPDAAVGGVDLLVGLLVAHGADSDPWQLSRYFGVAMGPVVGAQEVSGLRGAEFRTAFERVGDRRPPWDPEVEVILGEVASDLIQFDSEGLLTFRALFGALLTTPNRASNAIRRALDERGAPSSEVVDSYRDYLAGPDGYHAFLGTRFPWPPPRELPAYSTDRPPPRLGGTELAGHEDLVGISAEIDAFAFLIASKTLPPPLAIGLFGDWGSGKSYFLRSLQRRIDRLLADGAALPPDQVLPFHRSIVQIEFNAWQYVQGDLWASLLDHIIRNLAPSTNEDDLLDVARRRYLAEIGDANTQGAALLLERQGLEEKRHAAEAEVDERRAEREEALAELERQRSEHPMRSLAASPHLRDTVQKIAKRAGVGAIVTQAEDLAEVLAETRTAARQAGGMAATIRRGGWKYTVSVFTVLAATPFVVWGLAQADMSAVTQASAAVVSLLATAVGVLKTGNRWVRELLQDVEAAERQLRVAEDKRRKELDAEVTQAEGRLLTANTNLVDARRRQADLTRRVGDLEGQLAAVTPARVLDDFLKDRLGSDDYRRYLGLPAIVRRDLERLSNIIEDENEQSGSVAAGGINRVVLYIDDLDRCPTTVVLQVLQAVHLLLAFPLFVVVVAVDSRWLAGSLREHYRAQLQDGVTPDDYLEKIFQIAYWAQPLGLDVRRRMVRGLLARNLTTGSSESGPVLETHESENVEHDLDELLRAMHDTRSQPPAWLEAATLAITAEELAFIEQLAPLLGGTPRSVKRFVNVFQLVKTIARSRGPLDLDSLVRLTFLLAVSTGRPETARDLFSALAAANPGDTLGSVAETLLGHADLKEWLDDNPAWPEVQIASLAPWMEPVRRFWFRADDGGRTRSTWRDPVEMWAHFR